MALSGSESLSKSTVNADVAQALAIVSVLVRSIQLPMRGPNSALSKTANISEWPRRPPVRDKSPAKSNLHITSSIDQSFSQLKQPAQPSKNQGQAADSTVSRNGARNKNADEASGQFVEGKKDKPLVQSEGQEEPPVSQSAKPTSRSLIQRLQKVKEGSPQISSSINPPENTKGHAPDISSKTDDSTQGPREKNPANASSKQQKSKNADPVRRERSATEKNVTIPIAANGKQIRSAQFI